MREELVYSHLYNCLPTYNVIKPRQIYLTKTHPKRIAFRPTNSHMFYFLPFQRKELRQKLLTYTKFLVVRHPLERLLSAFRNKFESNSRDAKVFKRVYGAKMIRKYRRGTGSPSENLTSAEDLEEESAKKTGEGVRFSEFVSFLLDKKDLATVNEHWRPYESLCHPCAVSYDVIGKYETLEEDSERFLRLIGAPEGLHFPRYAPTNTSALLRFYLASVKPGRLAKLMMAYQRDFQLFQYDGVDVPRDKRL